MEITNFLKKLKSTGRKLSLEVYLVYSVYNTEILKTFLAKNVFKRKVIVEVEIFHNSYFFCIHNAEIEKPLQSYPVFSEYYQIFRLRVKNKHRRTDN